MVRILTARDSNPNARRMGYRAWLESLCIQRWSVTPVWAVDGTPAFAEIHAGQWVVLCPDCPEIVIYEPGELFYCPNCLNRGNKGMARGVVLPARRDWIEAVLLRRINPANRNWLQGETVNALIKENLAHPEGVVS